MNTLLPSKFSQLSDCESVISAGIANFISVGNALLRIRDARLYRATHQTFAEYCRSRWGMSKAYSNRTIQAAQIVGILPLTPFEVVPTSETTPIGAIQQESKPAVEALPTPTSEASIRPLSKIPEEQRPVAYTQAVKIAGGKAPTAKQVEQAIEEIKPKHELANAMGFSTTEDATKAVEETEKPKALGMKAARAAVKTLDGIPLTDAERREAFDYVIGWIENQ